MKFPLVYFSTVEEIAQILYLQTHDVFRLVTVCSYVDLTFTLLDISLLNPPLLEFSCFF